MDIILRAILSIPIATTGGKILLGMIVVPLAFVTLMLIDVFLEDKFGFGIVMPSVKAIDGIFGRFLKYASIGMYLAIGAMFAVKFIF